MRIAPSPHFTRIPDGSTLKILPGSRFSGGLGDNLNLVDGHVADVQPTRRAGIGRGECAHQIVNIRRRHAPFYPAILGGALAPDIAAFRVLWPGYKRAVAQVGNESLQLVWGQVFGRSVVGLQAGRLQRVTMPVISMPTCPSVSPAPYG